MHTSVMVTRVVRLEGAKRTRAGKRFGVGLKVIYPTKQRRLLFLVRVTGEAPRRRTDLPTEVRYAVPCTEARIIDAWLASSRRFVSFARQYYDVFICCSDDALLSCLNRSKATLTGSTVSAKPM